MGRRLSIAPAARLMFSRTTPEVGGQVRNYPELPHPTRPIRRDRVRQVGRQVSTRLRITSYAPLASTPVAKLMNGPTVPLKVRPRSSP